MTGKKIIRFINLYLFFVFPVATVLSQSTGYIILTGKTKNLETDIDSVLINITENSSTIKSIYSKKQGDFSVKLKLQKKYILIFSKTGYATKKMEVNTTVPQNKISETYKTQTGMVLFEKLPGIDYSGLNMPVTKIIYINDRLGGYFSYDKNYASAMDKRLAPIKNEIIRRKEKERKIKAEVNSISNEAKQRILKFSRVTADTIIRNAEEKARKILLEAQLKTKELSEKNSEEKIQERIDNEVQKQIKEIRKKYKKEKYETENKAVIDPDAEANRIIKDAREMAEKIIADAYAEATNILREARIGSLDSITAKPAEEVEMNIRVDSIAKAINKLESDKIFVLIDDADVNLNIDDKFEISEKKFAEAEKKLDKVEKEIVVWENKIKQAELKLEIDRLKVKTKEDSLKLYEREIELQSMRSHLALARLNIMEKRKEIREKRAKILAQWEKIRNQRLILYFLIALTAMLVIIIIILVRGYRKKKRLNQYIDNQNKEIEKKNKRITSSILYARRIQKAILTPEKKFIKYFSESFVIFKPKDIVSGDFYWFEKLNGSYSFSVVDCTGHGVPGAIMSVIGYNGLNHAIRELQLHNAGKILDNLNITVTNTIRSENSISVKDGMDMSLCLFSPKNCELEYAGAYNPIYIVREKDNPLLVDGEQETPSVENGKYQLFEIRGDKQPIGDIAFLSKKQFTTRKIQLEKKDSVYLFTDGFADQFGGHKGKKFKYKPFKKLVLSLQDKSMNLQKAKMEETIEDWMGDKNQIDDITIMGIKII